ncbi:MAG: NAD-dependent epimerase/dehydratase family protein [Pyrobaculum sp.]
MRVVVTGGAGFLGSHLVDRLIEEGFDVVVVDNLSSGRREFVNNQAEFHLRDLKEAEWGVGIRGDVVFHFAANPEVRLSSTEPVVHFNENVLATFNVLEWARHVGVRTVVFASSSTVYGDAEVMPTPEEELYKPISVYGAAKAAGEVMCGTYARLYGVRCLAVRYANVVGPRLRHGVIYDFIMKLRRNPNVLEVLGDGTQRKSYLYVKDAVEATLLAWRKFEELQTPFLALNVGNQDAVRVLDIANVVAEVLGLKPEIRLVQATPDGRGWPGDVKYMTLSIAKLTKLTGWRPSMTSLEAVRKAAEDLAKELWQTPS